MATAHAGELASDSNVFGTALSRQMGAQDGRKAGHQAGGPGAGDTEA